MPTRAASGQSLPVMVGQEHEQAVAALKARGIDFREEAAGAGKRITYGGAEESVTLDFTMWPKDSNAPASAWESADTSNKRLLLTHILDVAPGSDARRNWVRTFEKEGRHWAYLSEKAMAQRPAAERSRYPVVAFLQWPGSSGSAPVTLLFQAARPAGSPPGKEATVLEVFLENPHKPHLF